MDYAMLDKWKAVVLGSSKPACVASNATSIYATACHPNRGPVELFFVQ